MGKETFSCLLLWLIPCVSLLGLVHGDIASELPEADDNTWQQAYNENQKLLVLFYQLDGCDGCPQATASISQIVGQPEIPSGVKIVRSSSLDLASKLQVSVFPALVYLRDKSYVTYDGSFEVEELLEWVQLAGQRVTQRLDQGSFEHLTQASTGATTGDWLVAFYKDSCKDVLSALETLGVRLRGRMNVAKVDMVDSPGLVDRFKVTGCPQLILFKQGKMYRYELPALDAASLRSFVDGFYKNVRAENVPLQKSQFDFLTESIADFIKSQVEGENGTLALCVLGGLAASLLLIVFCCCRAVIRGPVKEKTE